MKIVIYAIGNKRVSDELIPYLNELVMNEDDEVLFAIAEEIGRVFSELTDKTAFLPILEMLAAA